MDPILYGRIQQSRGKRMAQFIKSLPGLVGYWPCNEIVNSTLITNYAPATLGSLNLTIQGNLVPGDAGRVGRSVVGDGVSGGRLPVSGSSTATNVTTKVTMGIFASTKVSSQKMLMDRDFERFALWIASNRRPFFQMNDGSGYYSSSQTSVGMTLNTWHFICLVFDQTLSSKHLNIYIDGVNRLSEDFDHVISPTGTWALGAKPDGTFSWNGNFQHAFLCNDVISTDQITRISRLAGF